MADDEESIDVDELGNGHPKPYWGPAAEPAEDDSALWKALLLAGYFSLVLGIFLVLELLSRILP